MGFRRFSTRVHRFGTPVCAFVEVPGSRDTIAVPIAALTGSRAYHPGILNQPAERFQENPMDGQIKTLGRFP